MQNLDPKLIMAFVEALDGNQQIFRWLLVNRRELAALVSCMHHQEDAQKWLMSNGFPHYAAFASAIDGKEEPYKWLAANGFELLCVIVDAAYEKQEAIDLLNRRQLQIFVIMARRIRQVKQKQAWDYEDYHSMHF